MSYNYPLKYRTFTQVLDEVAIDFSMYALENMISPEQLIKVAKKINYDLGLRIMMTKEALLDIEKGRVKLPDDFYTLNYALICDETVMVSSLPQGTHVEERLITPYQDAPPVVNMCAPPQIECRAPGGCGCNSGCTCDGGCGCGNGNCLCPQCNTENSLCSTTNSTVTTVTETVVIPPVIATVHTCSYATTVVEIGAASSLVITIDGVEHTCAEITPECLNALGLGTFSNQTVSGVPTNVIITVVGDHVYGSIHLIGDGEVELLSNCVDIVTVLEDTSACSWSLPQGSWSSIQYLSIRIDDAEVVLHMPFDATALADLNALGLGVFTMTILTDGTVIIAVHGIHIYGQLDYDRKGSHVDPVCQVISNTPGSTQTTTTKTADTTKECYSNPPACKPRVILNCKGEEYELVQVVNATVTNYYKRLLPIKILQNAEAIECGCPNLYISSQNTAWIKNGFLYTNFPCGKVYINYQGTLIDDDNNILVPDHDGMNEYYEYALKARILENLAMNDEPVGQKIQLIEARLKAARLYALTVVNTPNFAEMKELWWANRRAQYAKYYDMFKSYNWYQWDRNPNLDMMQNPGR